MALHAVGEVGRLVAQAIQRNGRGGGVGPVTNAFANLMAALSDNDLRRAAPLNSASPVSALSNACESLSPHEQQDAEEGFTHLCGAIDAEVRASSHRRAEAGPFPIMVDDELCEFGAGVIRADEDAEPPCARTTGFNVEVAFHCPLCGAPKPGRAAEFFFRLPVGRLRSMSLALASALGPEVQEMHFECDGDAGCGHCTPCEPGSAEGREEVVSRRNLRGVPRVLAVCVRRFWVDGLGVGRSDTAPMDVGFEVEFGGEIFALSSFVVHYSLENSARSGHYKSWGREANGSWTEWDDEAGSEKSLAEAREEAKLGHLFFFARGDACDRHLSP